MHGGKCQPHLLKFNSDIYHHSRKPSWLYPHKGQLSLRYIISTLCIPQYFITLLGCSLQFLHPSPL